MTTRAALYLRQSVALGDDTAAVDRQRVACERLADERGLTIVQVYVDNDTSASRGHRAAYDRMLQDWAAGGFSAIIAWDQDRLMRQPKQLEHLIDLAEQNGMLLYTASGDADLSTDAGRLYARIRVAVARAEVERKSARQKLKNQQLHDSGMPVWRRRPFGFELSGAHREPEAQAIRDAHAMLLAGDTLRSVQRMMDERGLLTPAAGTKILGQPWSLSALRKALQSPRNGGLVVRDGEERPAAFQGIVSAAEHKQLVHLLQARAAASPTGSGHAQSLLAGVAACGVCGLPVQQGRRANGARLYRCTGPVQHLGKSADACDAFVEEWVVTLLGRDDVIDVLEPAKVDSSSDAAKRDALRLALAELEQDYRVLKLMDRASYLTTQKTLTASLAALEKQMLRGSTAALLGPLAGPGVDVRGIWTALPLDRKRAVLRVLATVTVLPGRALPVALAPLAE